jgi:hypothetical protein
VTRALRRRLIAGTPGLFDDSSATISAHTALDLSALSQSRSSLTMIATCQHNQVSVVYIEREVSTEHPNETYRLGHSAGGTPVVT